MYHIKNRASAHSHKNIIPSASFFVNSNNHFEQRKN
jgi:hypothetical protein